MKPRKAKKIFGLSVTERIEWAIDDASDGRPLGNIESDVMSGIPDGNLPFEPDVYVDIEYRIRKALEALKAECPGIFDQIDGIGVSTIGIVDRDTLRLDNIVRKNWGKRNCSYIIDFKELFLAPQSDGSRLFPRIANADQIVVQNDASARCKAEYLYAPPEGPPLSSMLYLMAGEGINGAVVYGGDLLNMPRHSEMGHCKPQLDPLEASFEPAYSGCPAHKTCFEGLMSLARLRQQWPQAGKLGPKHPAWEREVNYLAQLAMIGVTTLNPERIRFGGAMFAGQDGLKLVEDVRSKFIRINAGYLPDYTSEDSVRTLIERATFGDGAKILSALAMGCLAAFPESRKRSLVDTVNSYHETLVKKRG